MSTKKVYTVKDKVFAKVRGYPAWPAVISGVEADTPARQRYHVYFYGTGERAVCKSDELFPYEENKAKLGKPNKRKHFAEALLQIENDTDSSFITDGSIQAFQTPTIVDQSRDTTLNESESIAELEKTGDINSENEGKLTIDETNSSKGKKSLGFKKSLGLSMPKGSAKRKLSDGKLDSPAKRAMPTKGKGVDDNDSTAVVVIEKIKENDTDGVQIPNEQSSSEGNDTSEKHLETQNSKNDSMLDASESSKSLLKLKTSPSSSGDQSSNSSNVGQVSRSGRKIKPKKYSDYENDAEAPKRSRLSKDNTKNLDMDNSSTEQNELAKGAESNKKLKSHATSININDGVSNEMNQVSKTITEDGELPEKLKGLMAGAISNCEVEWKKVTTSKAIKVEFLSTEVDLLDSVYQLRMALRTDKADCDRAIEVLDKMAELKLSTLMLKKHSEVVDTVKKVTMYIGNIKEWGCSEEEANAIAAKTAKVRRKANMVFNKFRSLFTVPEGQSFLDTFKKEVDEFYTKTKHLACDQIYGLTSEKQLI